MTEKPTPLALGALCETRRERATAPSTQPYPDVQGEAPARQLLSGEHSWGRLPVGSDDTSTRSQRNVRGGTWQSQNSRFRGEGGHQ